MTRPAFQRQHARKAPTRDDWAAELVNWLLFQPDAEVAGLTAETLPKRFLRVSAGKRGEILRAEQVRRAAKAGMA